MENRCVLLIPALNPPEYLNEYLELLKRRGFFSVIIVDDGSRAECRDIFEKADRQGCIVLHHQERRGKGAALKTGMSCYLERFSGKTDGIVTVNSDGSDSPEDIGKVAQALGDVNKMRPNSLVLGVRDLNSPALSGARRVGNKISRMIYRLLMNIRLQDTLTGLRGIPDAGITECTLLPGNGYEYETAMLIAWEHKGYIEVPASTQKSSSGAEAHYRPVRDTFQIYLVIFHKFLMFAMVSLSVSALDVFLFWLFTEHFLEGRTAYPIIWGTIIARVISASINYVMNRRLVFQSNEDRRKSASMFVVLSIVQCMLSAVLVHALEFFSSADPVGLKIIVDVGLFFANYKVQHMFIFKKEE